MAKQVKPQNSSSLGVKSFDKELNEDVKNLHIEPNSWSQARNATPNSITGDLGDLGNEPGNLFCAQAPYTVIGFIHLEGSRWVVYSTDDVNSEIGHFNEERCEYVTLVNDPCLNFNRKNLISGIAKENPDCSWQVYWADGRRNPDRTMNVDKIPWIQECMDENGIVLPGPIGYQPVGCITCVDTPNLDCEAIRLAPLIQNPCFFVQKGASGGELLNGSYYVVGAYTINQQKIGDYSVPSNVQALFSHSNVAGSLDIVVDSIDDSFDEFELILVITRNQQTVARRVGIYSTRQKRITIDTIDDRWPTVGIDLIPLRTTVADRSDAIFRNGDYALRVGPTDKFDFNYQPLANQIETYWVSVEYPADYYRKGGNKTGHMRDEVYAYFIRWVYNTGDKSPSFHIPGRAALPSDLLTLGGQDAQVDVNDGLIPYAWRVRNTAYVTAFPGTTLPDGGVVIAEGKMGYWESTEYYDDDRPQVWNASSDPIWGSVNPAHDLCGKPIRHHRFPDNNPAGSGPAQEACHFNPVNGSTIRVMGVRFDNIQAPLDNQGNPIPDVVGYEILRGTREGNKSIVAKGMLNNMRKYDIAGGITGRTGLYPNYPYNDLRVDDSMLTQEPNYFNDANNVPFRQTAYSKTHFTFHSPDTSFKDPFLSAKELRIYGEFNGLTNGQFQFPEKHPKHKFVTNLSMIVSIITGAGFGLVALNGERKTSFQGPRSFNLGQYPTGVNIFAGPAGAMTLATPWDFGALSIAQQTAMYTGGQTAANLQYQTGAVMLSNIGGFSNNTYYTTLETAGTAASNTPGHIGMAYNWEQTNGPLYNLPLPLRILNAVPTFSRYFTEGADETLRLIKAFSQYQQHALQYISECFYNRFRTPIADNGRRILEDAIYLDPQLQDYGTNYRINNVFRGRTVALNTTAQVQNPLTTDNSRRIVATAVGPTYADPTVPFNTQAASHYVGLRQRLRNQYGQLEGIIQVPVTTCAIDKSNTDSGVLFNGDIYIGRYTEKNTFFYFYDWLFDQPDGAELNYKLYNMMPYPRYQMDTEPFDTGEFINSITSNLLTPGSWVFPSTKFNFDRGGTLGIFIVKQAYMYLFQSGVRDFFVESEINIDNRDWGDNDTERHYDPYLYSDLRQIFNTSIIKSGNYFKYDFSLSISRIFNNFISWGNTQKRNYDPLVAETCFVHKPNRVIYSLPQQLEQEKDFWRVFLPNNYRDFKSRITAIRPINKNGAIFLFENEAPIQFLGVDQLQTDAGTKITIGDGGLFSQPQQNILNTDDPYEYGSCQNRLAVMNTASGLFWMSQNQGKIFQMQNGIKEISMFDMKWWLASYLPYVLTQDFPDFELTDNPVVGIGCQAIYDNENQLAYFCKKDYQVRRDILDVVTYVSGDDFLVNGILPIKLGDPRYFRDASWTVSYDPKTESWISYHDWHPNLVMPSKHNFLSIDDRAFWRHNYRCDLYCNYYGVDYPFEVEFTTVTPQQVNTVRSIEYYMEVYRYDQNCYDRFHVLDFNFDEAVVYNTEQCSGLLRLNISPKNNAPQIVAYPQVNPTNIDILYSKEEQKYRFNQFWDITDDRGEFNPAAERMIWNTEPNGYIRNLNPNNLNYDKFQLERKKFRHYKNTVLLRRLVSGNRKMLISLANVKQQYSPR
ncbi:hypothetical protein E6Q11_00390 [Candidatus Dojkabacteria bacterium]|uniref:Uncharacterized protein n=1 Tax=Candidatus Dojkabacteria bacterium TaxID=2099670 RepID=A0A5C7JCJ9_9BACT|nr:MAG: hypothetical protein E6Q11_00390 [Candidatus Dojkabacteria bacterium]